MNESTEYSCHGFHEGLAKGKASGKIKIDATGVHCIIGDQQVPMSFERLRVFMGGASNRLVFLEHPSAPGWSVYTSDRTILKDSHLKNQPSLASIMNKARRVRHFGWGLIALVGLLVVGLPLLAVLNMDVFSRMVAKQVPAEWETKLGESTIAQYRINHHFMKDEDVKRTLLPIVDPLIKAIPNSKYSYHFYVVNDGTLNAFALPGGYVVVHSALILKAENAEELLGVLAHEITHVEQQHGVRNVIGAAGLYVIASAVLGDVSGVIAVLGGAAPLLLNQSYSRGFESEADEKGFALLEKARINPIGLETFFAKLIEEEKKMLDGIDDEKTRELVTDVLQFLSTHPASKKRIEKLQALRSREESSQTYINLDSQFQSLQQAVKQFVTENNSNEETVDEN